MHMSTVADPAGGAAGAHAPPLFSQKYFKKSPKLAIIYKKILGASHENTGRPLSTNPGFATGQCTQ